MSETPLTPQSPLQQQIAQMAIELASQLEDAADQASPGNILNACESHMLQHGRQFLRDSLAATLQQQVDRAEKKGGPRDSVHADSPVETKETRHENV